MGTYYYNADRRNELGMDRLCYAISGRNGKPLCNQNLRVLFEGLPKKFWFLLDTRCVSAIDIDHAQTVGACISAWLMYGRSGPQKELSMIFPIDGHGGPFFTGPFNEWLRSLMRGLGSQLKHDLYAGGFSDDGWSLINHIAYALARENYKKDYESWDEYRQIEGVHPVRPFTYKDYELKALCVAQQFIDWYDGWVAQGLPVDGEKV